MSPALERGTCPLCEQDVALRNGGLLREHRVPPGPDVPNPRPLCEGAGELAVERRPRQDGLTCGNCNDPLYIGHTLRRRIPRKGGRKGLVCATCASGIDRQLPLELEGGEAA